ncbi:Glycerol-3-phosphate dehydrogenase [NAD(+)] [Platanthera guangdongensis]|uniref:glycerol-3-phosphate dehydrogenase (NAD(+)) n=1 Tax=Platanthera guangdongensis TaxID=2320717 RepID=A0ABR2M2I4_9ASPA
MLLFSHTIPSISRLFFPLPLKPSDLSAPKTPNLSTFSSLNSSALRISTSLFLLPSLYPPHHSPPRGDNGRGGSDDGGCRAVPGDGASAVEIGEASPPSSSPQTPSGFHPSTENVKYLPGVKLGKNVVADPDLENAVREANMLVFVTPHQFMEGICKMLVGKIRPEAEGISLIKGMEMKKEGPCLISKLITDMLSINCCVLMGLVDGLDMGNNTKAAIMRIGLREMRALSKLLFSSVKDNTFFESCGVADVITTCLGGRNRRVAEAFAKSSGNKSFDELEAELLQGQKLQGVSTAKEVYDVLSHRGWKGLFPFFTTVHEICIGQLPPSAIVEYGERTPKFSLDEGSSKF